MRDNDQQLGKPMRVYRDTKANIDTLALTLGAADEGCEVHATDVDRFGVFDGAAMQWYLPVIQAHLYATQGIGTRGNPWSGPGDDLFTSPLQLAVNAVPAAGGVVYMKGGYYEEQDPTTESARKPLTITERDNIIIWAEAGAVLHYTCNNSGGEAIMIKGRGPDPPDLAQTTLTVNASSGDWTITVANTAGFVVDQWVMVQDTKVYGTDEVPPAGCLAGEVHRIRAIGAGAPGTLSFYEPLWDPYLVARTAKVSELILNRGIQIHNLTVEGNAGAQDQRGVFAWYTENLILKNMTVFDCNYSGIALGTCIHPLVENSHITRANEASNGYAIGIMYATQHARIMRGTSRKDRHAISVTGSRLVPGRPRDTLVDGFIAHRNINSSFDVHPGPDHVTFRDCVSRHNGGTHGYAIRGNSVWLENCKVVNGGGAGGVWFLNETAEPSNFAVLGGSIECDGHAIRITESSADYLGGQFRAHNCESIRIEGVDMKPSTNGILYDCGGNPVLTLQLVIVGNTIKNSGANTGITVQKVKCGSIGDNTIQGGSDNSIGIDLQDDTQHVVVKGNAVHSNKAAGSIGVKYAGSRNLVVGNNLYQTANALSDVGANNQSASNLDELGNLS